jgi:hypothetical protein
MNSGMGITSRAVTGRARTKGGPSAGNKEGGPSYQSFGRNYQAGCPTAPHFTGMGHHREPSMNTLKILTAAAALLASASTHAVAQGTGWSCPQGYEVVTPPGLGSDGSRYLPSCEPTAEKRAEEERQKAEEERKRNSYPLPSVAAKEAMAGCLMEGIKTTNNNYGMAAAYARNCMTVAGYQYDQEYCYSKDPNNADCYAPSTVRTRIKQFLPW